MKKQWVILYVLIGVLVSAQDSPRPSLITEMVYTPTYGTYNSYRRQGGDAFDLWQKVLYGLGLTEAVENHVGRWGCHYDTALEVLSGIRKELGKTHPYQRIWAKNQIRVLDACHNHTSIQKPEPPKGEGLPKRAIGDYLYQLASWHFYARQYDDALANYHKVEAIADSPMRPYATYMVMRSLAELGRAQEAVDKQEAILADDALRSVHAIAHNYRFIMGYYGFSKGWSHQERDSKAQRQHLVTEHLRWLLEIVRAKPEKAQDIKAAKQDYEDALYQLKRYFPYTGETLDWWLDKDVQSESLRMRAVQIVAQEDELADWMQADWAFNIFDSDWLWAAHQPQNPYWQENARIVKHAWNRWQAGDGLEWLEIAIKRVHPQDALATNIYDAAQSYINRAWEKETPEYRTWLQEIFVQSVRVAIGQKRYEDAYALFAEHQDMKKLLGDGRLDKMSYAAVIGNSVRWLAYTGEFEQARYFLHYAVRLYPDRFQFERVLLATDWKEVEQAMQGHRTVGWNRGWHKWRTIYDVSPLWRAMVNRLPAKTLYAMANNAEMPAPTRPILAQVALTRAMLLDKGALAKSAAALVAELLPSTRNTVLQYAAEGNLRGYQALMLRSPRMRLVPFPASMQWDRTMPEPMAIDGNNINDNNWWCSMRLDALKQAVWNAASITPHIPYRTEGSEAFEKAQLNEAYWKEVEVYHQLLQGLLAKHPYHALVDEEELQALAAFPSGPQYLSEAVIAREKIRAFWPLRSREAKSESAANLHFAVRTTRYGCRRDGAHGDYSQKAFALLHRFYGDTVWAEATPYWFNYGRKDAY